LDLKKTPYRMLGMVVVADMVETAKDTSAVAAVSMVEMVDRAGRRVVAVVGC
jgi:hypothetical protein